MYDVICEPPPAHSVHEVVSPQILQVICERNRFLQKGMPAFLRPNPSSCSSVQAKAHGEQMSPSLIFLLTRTVIVRQTKC